jgi:hypothetical protein
MSKDCATPNTEMQEAIEANTRHWRLWYAGQRIFDVPATPPFDCGHPFEVFAWDEEDNASCLWCASVAVAETRGAERERESIIKRLEVYMRGCEETGCKLADSDDEVSSNMYWRADGASDALEFLIGEIHARAERKDNE